MAQISTIRESREQTTLDRFLARHTLLSLGILIGGFAGLLIWVVGNDVEPWAWYVVAVGVGLSLLGIIWLDRVIAIPRLWSSMCGDAGLVSGGSGIPSVFVYRPGMTSVSVMMSRGGFSDTEIRKTLVALGYSSPYGRVQYLRPVGKNWVALRFYSGASTLEKVVSLPLELSPDKGILLGLNEDGKKVYLPLSGGSGALVGGLPGSGKTYCLRRIIASLRGLQGFKVCVIDGKGTHDFDDLSGKNVLVKSGSPDYAPDTLETLEKVEKEMLCRAETGKIGSKIVLIIDEVQGFTDTSGLSGEEKKAVEKSAGIIRRLVQKGRSLGIFTILATQKADASTIPTKLRDNLGIGVCFRVRNPETGKMVLGDGGDDALGLPEGVAVLDTGKDRELVKVSAFGEK